MIQKTEPTYRVKVHLAGDFEDARRSLRRQALEEGLCVTLHPVEFVYTAGMESGVTVGLTNYPRFPKSREELFDRAVRVAVRLMDDLCQHSALVEADDQTQWLTKRPEDLKSTK